MAKIVCVLYPDPDGGQPSHYARDSIPAIRACEDVQTPPSPRMIDLPPGELLGDVSGGLGLRTFPDSAGHSFYDRKDVEDV